MTRPESHREKMSWIENQEIFVGGGWEHGETENTYPLLLAISICSKTVSASNSWNIICDEREIGRCYGIKAPKKVI